VLNLLAIFELEDFEAVVLRVQPKDWLGETHTITEGGAGE